jgi:hypothetical protein
MHFQRILTSGALCVALGLSGGAVFAESAAGLEDAVTKADEAAEAEAKAAEAKAEAAVEREKKEAAQGAKLNAEEVSGDMNPIDEGDAAQMEGKK